MIIPFSFWVKKGGIIENDLICYLDAGNTASYSGSGTTWVDLTGNSNGTIGTTGLWNSNGFFELRRVSTNIVDLNLVGINSSTDIITIEMWVKTLGRNTGTGAGMNFGFSAYDIFHNTSAKGFNTANADIYGLTDSYLSSINYYNEWRHITMVFHQNVSVTNNKWYINSANQSLSQIQGTEFVANRSFSNGLCRINSFRNSTANVTEQDVAIFRAYNRELTQAEITNNYEIEKGRFGL